MDVLVLVAPVPAAEAGYAFPALSALVFVSVVVVVGLLRQRLHELVSRSPVRGSRVLPSFRRYRRLWVPGDY